MSEVVDFTAHAYPMMAVRCPTCQARPGTYCKRPSGHRAAQLHKARGEAADTVFIAQHGEAAGIEKIDGTWVIDLQGYAKWRARKEETC